MSTGKRMIWVVALFAALGLFSGCGGKSGSSSQDSDKTCPRGYTKDSRGECVDINECLTDNGGCDPLTSCTNTPGGRTCGACPPGYTGNGLSGCVDINECLADNGGCDPLTSCTNTPGGRTCGDCPSGYAGSGLSGCVDVNDCLTDNGGCDPLTTCMNTVGECTCGPCPPGYAGDPRTGCVPDNACMETCVLPETCGGGGVPGVCGVALQKCQSGDSVCPLECNDWALDSDCGGVPGVHNFVFPDDPSVLLGNPWQDPTIKVYLPLVDKVAELTGGLTLEYDKAYALAAWVKGKAEYDLTFQCPETIAELMGIDKGYCEQSAHLLSYALRTAGIPAAVSVQGGHSLTVANVDGQWVDFDATFGEGAPGVTNPGMVGNVVDQTSWHLPADVFIQPFAAPYIFREPQIYMPKTRRVPLVKSGGTQAGWGTVLIPVTNQRLFIRKDGSVSVKYDAAEQDGLYYVIPRLRSFDWFQTGHGAAHLPGDWDYLVPTEYSVMRAKDHLSCDSDTLKPNGYVKVALPEGAYEVTYDWWDATPVARRWFTVGGGDEIRIAPGTLEKAQDADGALFGVFIDSLSHATEGL
ncbi:MAG: hypothetical protein JXP48_03310 [Acidobacteria bacterium]|nr:hypothetical protein [Acidobacteriota bacterium]